MTKRILFGLLVAVLVYCVIESFVGHSIYYGQSKRHVYHAPIAIGIGILAFLGKK